MRRLPALIALASAACGQLPSHSNLYWIERRGGSQVRHATEPGTTLWQRLAVRVLSLLPIEWLL